MNPDEIKSKLKTAYIGKNIICLDETDSTNNECKRNQCLTNGTVVVSEAQTAGRGRRGNLWLSKKGDGLLFSVYLKPNIPVTKISLITLIAGLAVCRCVGGKIKYPNDIVIGTKKICGILTELTTDGSVICGIGINVNNKSFPDEISHRATSLKIENKLTYDRSRLLSSILNELEVLYKEFIKNGLNNLIEEYKSKCVTYQSEVNVFYNNRSISGICTDITKDGYIVIKNSDGEFIVNSGEVSVRGIYDYI